MREIWLTSRPVGLFAVEDGEGPGLVFLHGGLASHQAVLPLVVLGAPDVRSPGG